MRRILVPLAAALLAAASPVSAASASLAPGGCDAVAVAGGRFFSLSLTAAGGVWAWGSNAEGQLGDGTLIDRPVPVPVLGLPPIQALSGGGAHSLALARDGSVWAWGANSQGQLGDGSLTGRPFAAAVPGLPPIVAIAAGEEHSLALAVDGTVWAWGDNLFRQIAAVGPDRRDATQVAGLSGIIAMAAGGHHCLAVAGDGKVWAWGRNNHGQVLSPMPPSSGLAVEVTGLSGVIAVAGGYFHSLAVKSDGSVWSWGYNREGQLGDGTTIDRGLPAPVIGVGGVVSVSAGDADSVVLRSDGTSWAWGHGLWGQLGYGGTANRLIPTRVPAPDGIRSLEAGVIHTIFLRGDGTIWATGNNDFGEIGDGTTIPRLVPVQTDLPCDPCGAGIASIAAGWNHSLGLKPDGTVWSWGNNFAGQLGDGTRFTNRNVPGQALGLPSVRAVAAGREHSLSLAVDGTVWTHGENFYGQLGDGTTTTRLLPVQVAGLTDVKAIASGDYHSLALKSDGSVWTWGQNFYGELGDGSNTDSPLPLQVAGLPGIRAIGAGYRHCLALADDGTIWAWGDNYFGQMGVGTRFSNPNVPVHVTALAGVRSVAGGYEHSLAVTSDGAAWAWGWNDSGQLGDGTFTLRTLPVAVIGLGPVAAIAGGGEHSLAIGADGTAWSWGDNTQGALGDGTLINRAVPAPMLGLAPLAGLSGGRQDSLALDGAGNVWGCGTNSFGELGDGTNVSRLVPSRTAFEGGSTLVLTCPASLTLECPADTSPGATGDATTSGGCGPVTVSHADVTTSPCGRSYLIERTFTAVDDAGSTSCTQAIRVDDTTPPTVTAPADLSVECPEPTSGPQSEAGWIASAAAADGCGGAVVMSELVADTATCGKTYIHPYDFWAVDECGNESPRVRRIYRMVDTTLPTVSAPDDLTVECRAPSSGPLSETAWLASATASDTCGVAVVSHVLASSTRGCANKTFTHVHHFVATDECGNESPIVRRTYRVIDTTPPTLTAPADLSVECPEPASGPFSEAEWLASATASDTCGDAGVRSRLVSSVPGCGGTLIRTHELWAIDECGNESARVTREYRVVDTTSPILAAPDNLVVECPAPAAGPRSESEWLASATASDACASATVRHVLVSSLPGCGGTFTNVHEFWAVDDCGNESARVAREYRVVDTTPPTPTTSPAASCAWSPNHWWICLSQSDFGQVATDACSEPVTWRLVGCSSDQPANGTGDGNTEADCAISPDGTQACVRAERRGDERGPRTYAFEVIATDACGNASAPFVAGSLRVEHDASSHSNCVDPTTAGRRPQAGLPF